VFSLRKKNRTESASNPIVTTALMAMSAMLHHFRLHADSSMRASASVNSWFSENGG